MDNFFEILIIFFVIISILNSIFGKKKPQQKESEKQEDIPEIPQQKQNNKEIFERIFGIPAQKSEEEIKSQTDEYNTWNPEDEFKDLTEHKPEEIITVDYDKLESLEAKQHEIQKKDTVISLTPLVRPSNLRLIELMRIMKNPMTLRDYILVSEILNKPKAFYD